MDPSNDLFPVESIADNEHFKPLCLLKKSKPKTIFHPAPYYRRTGFTLEDVLLPGEDGKHIESLVQDFSQFTLSKVSADQADGGLSIPFDPASIGLEGAASSSDVISIKLQKKGISLESLEALRRERQINMDHSFIQQLQIKDINLYVVTEILVALEESTYSESTNAKRGFWAWIYSKIWRKSTSDDKQTLVIPKGCTLAFSAIQLHIRNGAWDLEHFPGISDRSLSCDSDADDPPQGILEAVTEEVKNHCHIFSKLSPHLMLIVLNTIKAVMRDNNLLQELSQKMEDVSEEIDGYELKTENPQLRDLFSTLQQFPRDRLLLLAKGIIYILDALYELIEDQLPLLLESLERKIVSQQLKLVENLLQHDLEMGEEPFHVDAGLLAFPHKEEQELTMALVELSGVELWENGSALPRHQPFEDVAALFVALYALNLLSASQ